MKNPADTVRVHSIFGDFDVTVSVEGHKSSEGDGRTAADIERERAQAKKTEAPTEPLARRIEWDS